MSPSLSICFGATLMISCYVFFFFNDTATAEIYTLSLHDALPICCRAPASAPGRSRPRRQGPGAAPASWPSARCPCRSEEHTSELQSRRDLVCRLLLEKKKKTNNNTRVECIV